MAKCKHVTIAQVQRRSPLEDHSSLICVHTTNRLPFLKHVSVTMIDLLENRFPLLASGIYLLIKFQVHLQVGLPPRVSITCLMEPKTQLQLFFSRFLLHF